MRCHACNKKIKQTKLSRIWYHKKTRSVYCSTEILRAAPKR